MRCWPLLLTPPFVTPRCQVCVHFFLEKQTKKNAQPNAQQLKFTKEAQARKVADEALLEQSKVQNTLVVQAALGKQGLLHSTIIITFCE